MLENIDELTRLCIDRERTWVTKSGLECTAPDPDLRTALQAQLAGARLLGVDEGVPVLPEDQARAVLERARKALEAKRSKESENGEIKTH